MAIIIVTQSDSEQRPVTVDGKQVDGVPSSEFHPNDIIEIDGHIGGFRAKAVAMINGGGAFEIIGVAVL